MKLTAKSLFPLTACAAQLAWGADPLDNWTTSNIATTGGFRVGSVAFGNGLFVAAGNIFDSNGNLTAGVIFTSGDGMGWTQQKVLPGSGAGTVVYGNGKFMVPQIGGALFSADGRDWMLVASTNGSSPVGPIVYGNGRYVSAGNTPIAGGGLRATIETSSDGVNWTPWYWTPLSGQYAPGSFFPAAYGNGQFVALGLDADLVTESVVTSPDGLNWTQHYASGPSAYQGGVSALTFGNGLFVAVGGYNQQAYPPQLVHAAIWTSLDGVNWTTQLDRTNVAAGGGPTLAAVGYGGGQFVAGGSVLDYSNGKPMSFTSPDGTNWITRDVPLGLFGVSFGNGQFVGLPGGGTVLRSGVIGKLGASLSPGSGVQGTLTGVAGQQFAIQSSTNLAGWSLLTNVTIDTNGLGQFSDPSETAFQQRFYRALLAQ